jgi:hypothetical protein
MMGSAAAEAKGLKYICNNESGDWRLNGLLGDGVWWATGVYF